MYNVAGNNLPVTAAGGAAQIAAEVGLLNLHHNDLRAMRDLPVQFAAPGGTDQTAIQTLLSDGQCVSVRDSH